jgi:hypothetical protein
MEMALRNRKGTIWRGSPALIMMLASLCLSLFAWGIGYKLSLYKASEERRPSMPAAKLLSQKERPGVSASLQVQVPQGKPLALTLMALLTAIFALEQGDLSILCPTFVRAARAFRVVPAVYSRPPPSCV